MPKILQPEQREAVKRILAGESVTYVADDIGVDRRTLQRWKSHYFGSQHEQSPETDVLIGAANELKTAVSNAIAAVSDMPQIDLQRELQQLKEDKDEARKYFERLGKSFLIKAIRRLQDLPDEAIAPNIIPQYAEMALKLIRFAHEGAAEDLQINKLIEQLIKPGEEAGQSRDPKKIVRVVVDPKDGEG